MFETLLLDKEELLDDIEKRNSSSKSFLACVGECVSEREPKALWKGLDNKTNLHTYKRFVVQSEFKVFFVMQGLVSLDQACMI